jgi:hypothetical protein
MAMELAARPWITAGVALVLPTLQQVIADLLDGKQIDLQAAGNAAVTPFLPGSGLPPGEMPPAYLYSSLDPIHTLAYTAIHGTLTSPDLQSLLASTASPLSSVLLGDLGPILDPGLALENSIQDALAAPDPQSALFDLLNIPANIADATLNGEFLDGNYAGAQHSPAAVAVAGGHFAAQRRHHVARPCPGRPAQPRQLAAQWH